MSKKARKTFGMLVGATIGATGYTIYKKKRKKTGSAAAERITLSTAPGTFTKRPGCSAGSSSGNSADISQNIILCKGTIPIETNERINSNILFFGGSGAGKRCNIMAPNLLQMDASYVITDPGGGLLRSYGTFLENMGYRIKCLNLINTEQSNHYNPFAYIRAEEAEEDIQKLAEVLINALPPEPAGDPSRYDAGLTLLKALIGYLYYYNGPETQTLANIIKLLQAGIPEIYEENEDPETPLDMLFEKAEEMDPDGYAVDLYSTFRGYGSPQKRRDFLMSLRRHLAVFSLDKIEELTATDDIELDTVGDRKTALFVVIPTKGYRASNLLATTLYTQVFRCLEDYADKDAPKTKLVVDGNKEIIKTFRPDDAADDAAVRERAEDFLDRAKKGQISYDDDLKLWTLRTTEGELVLWRGSQEEAEKAHASLKAGSVMINQEKNGRAHHLPVQTRFFLDAFTEIGILPDFPTIISTFNQYGASFFLFPHTLSQMQNMYPLGWDCITRSCDITVCLGGGIDTASARYIHLLSKIIVQNTKNVPSNQKAGASFCERIRIPLCDIQLKTLPEEKCLVLVSLHNGVYIGNTYNVNEHPRWMSSRCFDTYTFDISRCRAML